MTMLHGGRLRQVSEQFNIPLSEWLDLSTGINPNGYPTPPVPADVWRRLPEEQDGLEKAAGRYYGATGLLPVAGSQAAIMALPQCISGSRVTLLTPTFSEHPYAWRDRNIACCDNCDAIEARIDTTDILLLVNPNNPTGTLFPVEQLLQWHARLSRRGGWLIVDEAFVDIEPEASLACYAGRPNLVVLRSVGKFFGLAGARVGFVLGPKSLLHALSAYLGPWAVSGPSRSVVRKALEDDNWHRLTRTALQQSSARLAKLLSRHGLTASGGTGLFQWVRTPHARDIHTLFARNAILIRLFDEPPSLRFGLPGNEEEWRRFANTLAHVARRIPSELSK